MRLASTRNRGKFLKGKTELRGSLCGGRGETRQGRGALRDAPTTTKLANYATSLTPTTSHHRGGNPPAGPFPQGDPCLGLATQPTVTGAGDGPRPAQSGSGDSGFRCQHPIWRLERRHRGKHLLCVPPRPPQVSLGFCKSPWEPSGRGSIPRSGSDTTSQPRP